MKKTLQDRAVAWWNDLSVDRKVSLCNFHSKSIDEVYSHDMIKMFLYETTDTMCSCGKTQSQHESGCNPPLPEGVYSRCQNCKGGLTYDLAVPKALRAAIWPKPVEGVDNILCPECIMDKTIKFYTTTLRKYFMHEEVALPVKTKEEILETHYNKNLGFLSITYKQVIAAMEEYRSLPAPVVVLPEDIDPCIMQSAFKLDDGTQIIVYTSKGRINSFVCNESWEPQKNPFASSSWHYCSKSDREYHLKIRGMHKPQSFVAEYSTPL